MSLSLLYQGAEAKIFLDKEKNMTIKDRIPKSYRIKILDDKIRKQRTKAEAKLLEKASRIINAPKPFFSPDFYQIKMPFIDGKKLSEHLDSFSLEKQKQIMEVIGEETAKMHDADIIHGDLTTSNMILVEERGKNNLPARSHSQIDIKDNDKKFLNNNCSKKEAISSLVPQGRAGGKDTFSIFFIDFGLGFISHKAEDKAVDIHLLKQALEAKHFRNWEVLFENFLKGYKNSKDLKKIQERLNAVEKRGRYRQ